MPFNEDIFTFFFQNEFHLLLYHRLQYDGILTYPFDHLKGKTTASIDNPRDGT
jgi:hypothetical protein